MVRRYSSLDDGYVVVHGSSLFVRGSSLDDNRLSDRPWFIVYMIA